jgi:hypothetical protein
MPTTLTALLLIPLALLASCATGPKLTPEMEALRQSLNQRMANTSSTLRDASVSKMRDGKIVEHVTIISQTYKTAIQPNGDIQIDKTITSGMEAFVESSGQRNRVPTTFTKESITLKLDASFLRTTTADLSDTGIKTSQVPRSQSPSEYATSTSSGSSFRNFECALRLAQGKFAITQQSSESGFPSTTGLMIETIATSPDKAFIEGIVRDMKRFIELYKALLK